MYCYMGASTASLRSTEYDRVGHVNVPQAFSHSLADNVSASLGPDPYLVKTTRGDVHPVPDCVRRFGWGLVLRIRDRQLAVDNQVRR